MTNPTYRCPHCHKPVELELSKSGQLTLKTATPKEEDEKRIGDISRGNVNG